MTIQHEAITDPFVHEPKGAAAASIDTVYVANGAGSGVWEKITQDSINTAYTAAVLAEVAVDVLDGSIPLPKAEVFISAVIPNISAASTLYIPIPEDAEVIQMTMTLEGAITVADATISLVNAADAAILSQVVAFTASAAGTTYTATTPTNATLTGPTFMKLSTNGGSTDAQRLFVTIHLYVTRTL